MLISKQSLERPHEELADELPFGADITSPMQGIKVWTNKSNKFRVLRLHRSADYKKRSAKWVEEARAGLPYTDYLREFEIRWKSFQGKSVFLEDWQHTFHVSKEPLEYEPSIPIIRGWDFGLSPACLFAQLRSGGRLYVLREVIGEEIAIERFAGECNRLSLEWFPRCKRYIDIVDPQGFARRDTDERSCTSIMRDSALHAKPLPGIQNIDKRRAAVVRYLHRVDRGAPCLLIDPRCEVLIGGFDGGYHYAYAHTGVLRDKPEKNRFSHVHDACQYICSKADSVGTTDSSNVPIREAKYSFGKFPGEERSVII